MNINNKILSDITVHMKYAKYIPELNRRESWQELVTRNKEMHQKRYKHLHNEIEEVSFGDFVLSGGEIGAQLVMDATIRLIPEVIGNAAGLVDESFERHLLEYPLYTHPRVWKDMEVPEVLLSGNHKKIQMWKLKMSEKLTKFRRPDLWSKYIKS